MTNSKPISVTYSDEQLRILVEEYITMQRKEFRFKGVCSYVLYRAMEEERTSTSGLYESDELSAIDCERIVIIMEKILHEQRIVCITPPKDIKELDKQTLFRLTSC